MEQLLNVDEVSRHLGVSRQLVYAMIASGKLLAIQISPRKLRIPVKTLEKWILEQRVNYHDN